MVIGIVSLSACCPRPFTLQTGVAVWAGVRSGASCRRTGTSAPRCPERCWAPCPWCWWGPPSSTECGLLRSSLSRLSLSTPSSHTRRWRAEQNPKVYLKATTNPTPFTGTPYVSTCNCVDACLDCGSWSERCAESVVTPVIMFGFYEHSTTAHRISDKCTAILVNVLHHVL